MVKKDNQSIWIIIVIIALGIIWYGGENNWFNFSISNYDSEIKNAMNNTNKAYTLGIHFSMNTVCKGQSVTGYIDSNMAGALCTLYTDTGSGFKEIGSETLNSLGSFSQSLNPQVTGTAKFKAICILNNQYATSNEATLTVNDCNQPADTCTDTDGGIKDSLVGSVSYGGNQYNDNCKSVNSLNEYYCDDLGKMSLGVLPCENGCEGGKCLAKINTCADTDNGLTTSTFGTCSDNSGTPYMEDYCIGGQLVEQTCSNENKCVAQTLSCPVGSICDFGKCVTLQTPQQKCAESCNAIQLLGVDFNTGACIAYNPYGALSMAAVCSNNNGVYASATGCDSGDICCCR